MKALTPNEALKAYKNNNLKEVVFHSTENNIPFPTGKDFIQAFKEGTISREELEEGREMFKEVSHIHTEHAKELWTFQQTRDN